MSHRKGFTKVQLLIVLIILALIASLIVVALAKVREEANRMQCSNNFKQIGLAVHNYHDTNGHLPPLVDQGEGAVTGKGLPSILATLMPYIEATPEVFRKERSTDYYHAHSSVVFNYTVKESPYTQVGGMVNYPHPLFRDPSDTTAEKLRDVARTLPDGTTGYYATNSYAANGSLPWRTGTLITSFPRGTGNPILFAERPHVCVTDIGETIYNLWGVGFYSPHMPAFATLTPSEPEGLWSTGQIAPVEPLTEESLLRVKIGTRSADAQAWDFPGPVQRIRNGRPCDPRLPGTPHVAGMQVVMADGSVRVFSTNTNAWVFWSACSTGQAASRAP